MKITLSERALLFQELTDSFKKKKLKDMQMQRILLLSWMFFKTRDKDVKFMRFMFKLLLQVFRIRNGILDALGNDEERTSEGQEYRVRFGM